MGGAGRGVKRCRATCRPTCRGNVSSSFDIGLEKQLADSSELENAGQLLAGRRSADKARGVKVSGYKGKHLALNLCIRGRRRYVSGLRAAGSACKWAHPVLDGTTLGGLDWLVFPLWLDDVGRGAFLAPQVLMAGKGWHIILYIAACGVLTLMMYLFSWEMIGMK